MIYLIGSLRNPEVPRIANELRRVVPSHEIFDDWYAAGPIADDSWRDYEKQRGRTYIESLSCYPARHVFEFDLEHLERASAGVLVLPAGKSAHLELGYLLGKGKPGFILLDNPERWDVMYKFATGVFEDLNQLAVTLRRIR